MNISITEKGLAVDGEMTCEDLIRCLASAMNTVIRHATDGIAIADIEDDEKLEARKELFEGVENLWNLTMAMNFPDMFFNPADLLKEMQAIEDLINGIADVEVSDEVKEYCAERRAELKSRMEQAASFIEFRKATEEEIAKETNE